MKTKYQPEDIEALLAEKPFRELLAEERDFVLQHLASPEEYEQMREMLLAIKGASGNDDSETELPSPRVREELLGLFRSERKKRIFTWWNTIGYWLRDALRLDLPLMRIAVAALVLFVGIWSVMQFTGDEEKGAEPKHLAQNTPASKSAKTYEVPGTTLSKADAAKDSLEPGNSMNVVAGGSNTQDYTPPDPTLAANQAIIDFTKKDSNVALNSGSAVTLTDTTGQLTAGSNISGITSNAIHTQVNSNGATLTQPTYSYSWTPNFSTQATSANAAHPGSYTVTVGNSNPANSKPALPVNAPRSRPLAEDSTAIRLFFKVE